MKISVVIVEDEALVGRDLEQMLHKIDADIEVVTQLRSVKAALEWFKNNAQPDLLFLDIQLSDGVSFEVLEQIDLTCPIIFTTAYNEYALRAFKVNSIDYLLKPVDQADLAQALAQFRRFHRPKAEYALDIQTLLQDLRNPASGRKYRERFLVHHGNSFMPVNTAQIACFYRQEVIFVYLLSGEKYISNLNTMDEIEELLDPKLFFRANRQSLVNIQAVQSIRPGVNGKIAALLTGPAKLELDISREKAAEFKAWLEH